MISPKIERVTTVVERYVIDSPANGRDVSDVLFQINQRFEAQKRTMYDDSIHVVARDDEIHFEFTVNQDHDLTPERT